MRRKKKESSDKKAIRERLNLRAKVKNVLQDVPWLRTVVFGNLVWGTIFTALIVLILLPIQPVQEHTYEIGDIAKERIVAPFDASIIDQESTDRIRAEQVKNVRKAYIFKSDLWSKYDSKLKNLFNVVEKQIKEFSQTYKENPLETDEDTAWILQHEKYDTDFMQAVESERENLVPVLPEEQILRLVVKHFHHPNFRSGILDTLKWTMQRPIAGSAFAPTPGAPYDVTDEKSGNTLSVAVISVQEAKKQVSEQLKENLRPVAETFAVSVLTDETEALAGWLEGLVEPTAFRDDAAMDLREEQARNVTVTFNVKQREKIVDAGEPITGEILAKINHFTGSQTQGFDYFIRALGITFFVAFMLYALGKFTQYYCSRRNVRFHLFLLLTLTLSINLTVLRLVAIITDSISAYIAAPGFQDLTSFYWALPFPIGSMLAALLVGTEIAAIYSIVLVILSSFLFGGNFEILLYALVGCFTVIYGLRQYKERTALIKTGIALGLMNVITILAISLFVGNFGDTGKLIVNIPLGFLGGLLTAFVASFLLPLKESLFGIATEIKLLELSNHEHPLLRELFLKAPGTFQHSIVIGYLAEAAAGSIGANALFCRVASLYHDIGKMLKPAYYVENTDDMGGKHKDLSASMSALIIINHVKEGVELARRHRLPESIIDIIPQHHGTKLIRFFYEKARKQQNPELGEVKEEEFRYPGPKPQSREAGIIMLADGVEAAARTLEEPSTGRLKGVIKTIIDTTFIDGQLDECDLTLRDLNKCANAFLRVLQSIHHERIKYPGVQLEKGKKKKAAREYREQRYGDEIISITDLEPEAVKKLEARDAGEGFIDGKGQDSQHNAE